VIFTASAGLLLVYIYLESTRFMGEQTAQTIRAEITGLREEFSRNGLIGLKRVIEGRIQTNLPDPDSIYLLETTDGRMIAGNLDSWPEGMVGQEGLSFTAYLQGPSGDPIPIRAVGHTFIIDGRARLLVARSIEERLRIEERHYQLIVNGAIGMLILALAGGFILSRWTLARLEAINRTTREIIAGDLGRRVLVDGGGDEFDELAVNVNTMLQRIERLLAGMREVTDNIAHDLRTPLSRMRSRLELALLEDDHAPRCREVIEGTIAEAQGLIDTFNALLNIARADAGERRAEWEIVDLAELAGEVFELFEPLAEERGVALVLQAGRPVRIAGSRQLLAQAVANLVDNALKYTPASGRVIVRVPSGPGALIEVIDNGPGIPADQRDKAIERFVRLDSARSTSGNGLGLSLVKAVATLHDGNIALLDAGPGLHVRLGFPPANERKALLAIPAIPANSKQNVHIPVRNPKP